jgi:hypothetical protein
VRYRGAARNRFFDSQDESRAFIYIRRALSTSETAAALYLTEHNVKVRLHRGRAMARGWLFARVGTNAKNAFPFMGVRCDRVVEVKPTPHRIAFWHVFFGTLDAPAPRLKAIPKNKSEELELWQSFTRQCF